MLLIKVTRKCTSAWEFSLDVLMLISACFGFSTEDPMIQISAFRFPARSGLIPRGAFLVIFGVQKIIKKTIPQKIDFFGPFCNFQAFLDKLSTILGRFWDAHGFIFGGFLLIQFWYYFLDVFWEKMQTLEKWKHSSGPVNYSVLWRSPGSNKNIILSKKCCDVS